MNTRAPRVVGRYLLCEAIASGGMATVHLGRLIGPEGFSRTVAIKQLHPQYARDPEFISMFLDEARLAVRVHHPNVVSPLDVVVDPPELFIVMDYVHGEPLSRLLRGPDVGPVPPRITSSILSQVLLGLHAAHEAVGESGEPLGIVHRDVSPQNILVSVDGVVRVVDFGIAKATNRGHRTDSGKLKGKLGYMSPEQVRFEATDRRADVFAAGTLLWEMLTGRRLFGADNPAGAIEKILHADIPPPSQLVSGLDPRLDEVVLCALSRAPTERFDNARAMAVALETVVPPSSMLAVAEWLQQLAGAELRRRADRVADLEGTTFEDLTHALPRSALLGLGPLPTTAPAAEEAEKGSVSPTELSIEIDTGQRRSSRRRLALGLGAGAALLAGAAFGFALQLQPDEAPDSDALVVQGMPAPRQEPATHPAAAAPLAPPVLAGVSNAAAPSTADASVVVAPPRAPVRSVKQAPLVQSAKPTPSATKPPPIVKPAAGCDVPYIVDARGVKRFKEECF